MKNLKVMLCCGISASGKSSWAKQFVKDNQSWIRINRDDIREMIKTSPVLNHKGEEFVNHIQSDMIDNALMMKYNVIIDNTNLKREYIESICDQVKYKADVEFKFFPIALTDAIERDSKREKSVGEKVIRNQKAAYEKLIGDNFETVHGSGKQSIFDTRIKQTQIFQNPIKNGKSECIILDLDGTIAHTNGKRSPYDYTNVIIDDLDEVVREHIVYHFNMGRKVIVVSGRKDECFLETQDWLDKHEIPYHFLFMRNSEDDRKDTLVKEDIYNVHIKNDYNVICVWDDRESVVKMWRKLGLRCYQVAEGKH